VFAIVFGTAILAKASPRPISVVAGKRYRWKALISPTPNDMQRGVLAAGASAAGIVYKFGEQTDAGQFIEYEQTATETVSYEPGHSFPSVGGFTLTLWSAKEIG
jgi:hypothetical protein